MPRVLDNSQHYTWFKCPVLWYTTVIAGIQRKRVGQRNDPLCIGSLYHNGMENWYRDRKIGVDQSCIDENTPDKDTLDLVYNLLTFYAQKFPSDPWETESIEGVYQIPLIDGWNALAKIDKVAVVTTPTTIDTGVDGTTIEIPAGRYSLEHKTRGTGLSRASYIRSWRRRKQVDFQMLCGKVDGVIVNVAEKPSARQPTRKCQGCKSTFEFREWLPIKDNTYSCHSCGHEQELKPLTKEQLAPKEPEFFRIYQTRTKEQLEQSFKEFQLIATRMQAAIDDPSTLESNTLNCIDERWGYDCDFLQDCEELSDPLERPEFIQIENPLAYIGLED